MYDIKQFRPALLTLILLGMTGFAVATAAPGLWLLAVVAVAIQTYFSHAGRWRPIPRLLANGITLAAGAWCVLEISEGGLPVAPVGVFLVILQVVKLYEQRTNRDFGQLIVLSLLTMVAAAMTTGGTSLLFGLLFLAWVFVSLYTCLLFHLKVETDHARRAMQRGDGADGRREAETPRDAEATRAEQRNAADERRLRQNQRRLGSSMRRLTAAVAVSAAACGAVVFLLFPRGPGSRFFESRGFESNQTVTGFSGKVGFQDIARIQQDTSPAAYVWIGRGGVAIPPTRSLYFRGNTLDSYDSEPASADRWTWAQSPLVRSQQWEMDLSEGRLLPIGLGGEAAYDGLQESLLEQRIELEPTGVRTLFSLEGPALLQYNSPTPRDGRLAWSAFDGTLALGDDRVTQRTRYTVWSRDEPDPAVSIEPPPVGDDGLPIETTSADVLPIGMLSAYRTRFEAMRLATADYAEGGDAVEALRRADAAGRAAWTTQQLGLSLLDGWRNRLTSNRRDAVARSWQIAIEDAPSPAPDAILDFVLDPDVTGRDPQGRPLVEQRLARAGTTEFDEAIAGNIERYLRTRFRYSLDVSAQAAALPGDTDPLGWFVSEAGREGHCEFFAGTMTLACQSLGIPARMVVGFRTSEWNSSIERFVVRRSDAHAWVEVMTDDGWKRYDPTSDILSNAQQDGLPLLSALATQVRQWTDYVEYFWTNNVVAFDRGTQEGVQSTFFEEISRSMSGSDADENARGGGVAGWLKRKVGWDDTVDNTVLDWLKRRGINGLVEVVGGALSVLLPLAALIILLSYAWGKYRLHRRARRIGLEAMPRSQARRLARLLGFYDEMSRTLARAGYARPSHLTPREFAQTLTILPPDAFATVAELTDAYYRIRYGHHRGGREERERHQRLVADLNRSIDAG